MRGAAMGISGIGGMGRACQIWLHLLQRTLRPSGGYGVVVYRPKSIVQSPPDVPFSYAPLVQQIVNFFQAGKPPVPNDETLEIFAFMDAAQRSKEAGGKPMRLR